MRAEGASLQVIADAFQLTRERVRQIIREADGPSREDAINARRASSALARAELRSRALQLCRADPGYTMDSLAAALGVRISTLRAALGDDARRYLVATHRSQTLFTDEVLLEQLRQADAMVTGPLTVRRYNGVRAHVGGASAPLLLQRFGSWRAACAAAGVQHGRPARDNYARRWTTEELVSAVAQYLSTDGVRGSFADYERWARSVPSAPSGQTIRTQLGLWSRAKAAALALLSQRGEEPY